MRPSCPLTPAWSEEPLIQQTVRAIGLLHQLTVSSPGATAFKAPTLAYCFYLLQRALERGGENVGGDLTVIKQVLDVLSVHAKIRGEGEVREEILVNRKF